MLLCYMVPLYRYINVGSFLVSMPVCVCVIFMPALFANAYTQYMPKGQPGYDPFYKIHPFLTPLLENCKTAYTLGREISVDESMIAFKGWLP